jgi:hypothetical protein
VQVTSVRLGEIVVEGGGGGVTEVEERDLQANF